MDEYVTITMLVELKPERASAIIEDLPNILEVTSKAAGFRRIRAVREDPSSNRLIIIEEWDSEDHYKNYVVDRRAKGDLQNFVSSMAQPPQVGIWRQPIVSFGSGKAD